MDTNIHLAGKIICVRLEVVVLKLNNPSLILWEESLINNQLFKIININSAESSSSEPVLIWAVNLKVKWSDNLLWITVCWQYSAILNLLSSFIICDFRYITCYLIKYFFFKSCGWCFAQTTKRNYQILFWVTLRNTTNMVFFLWIKNFYYHVLNVTLVKEMQF